MDRNTETLPRLAIISGAGFGMRDFGDKPGLWFVVNLGHGVASLLCFFGEEMEKILNDNRIYEVQNLNGKPCYVSEEDGMIRFKGMADL